MLDDKIKLKHHKGHVSKRYSFVIHVDFETMLEKRDSCKTIRKNHIR